MRLIQITDCHLGPQQNESLLGLNTDQSLIDVLQLIQRNESEFNYLLCTGDIASAAHSACYQRFVERVRACFSQPIGWLPGNHDSATIMVQQSALLGIEYRLIDTGKWLIVLLDSSVPGEVFGQLASAELDFLQQQLDQYPDKHVMVCLHHQPMPVGSAWIDQYVVRNAQALWALVDAHPQIKIVTCGHVHQEFREQWQHATVLATPSTCVQFRPGCDDFTVDTRMPGYRWFELNDDGSFATGVERVTDKHYVIDYKSAGY